MGIIESMTTVFTNIIEWLITAIEAVVGLFYVEATGLTFLGTLSIVALSIGLFFLLLNVVRNFLSLRR